MTLTLAEIEDKAADAALAKSGTLITFTPGRNEDDVELLAVPGKRVSSGESYRGGGYMGVYEAALSISMKADLVYPIPVEGQEVAVDEEWFIVKKATVSGPWLDLELEKNEA